VAGFFQLLFKIHTMRSLLYTHAVMIINAGTDGLIAHSAGEAVRLPPAASILSGVFNAIRGADKI
jgi:hypothetical protein